MRRPNGVQERLLDGAHHRARRARPRGRRAARKRRGAGSGGATVVAVRAGPRRRDAVALVPERASNASETRSASRDQAVSSSRWPSARAQRSARRSVSIQSALISTGFPRRGVTTQSSTLASIQVSCAPSAPPREEAVLGITRIPKRVPARWVLHDFAERGEKPAPQDLLVAAACEPAADRVREPERAVRGVVLGPPLRESGNRLGIIPASRCFANPSRTSRASSTPARRETQARKRDHGVAPPVGEPRVARDDRGEAAPQGAPTVEVASPRRIRISPPRGPRMSRRLRRVDWISSARRTR